MASIIACLTLHNPDCTSTRSNQDGCEQCGHGQRMLVGATFNPPKDATMRERILLARMSVMFEARRMLEQGR